jgi:hypothetical protein
MIKLHVMQLFRSGPVTVTTLSAVADASAALVLNDSALVSEPSLGDKRTDDTPEASTICLILEPPFPIIMPQLEDGTKIRITKLKTMLEGCRLSNVPSKWSGVARRW